MQKLFPGSAGCISRIFIAKLEPPIVMVCLGCLWNFPNQRTAWGIRASAPTWPHPDPISAGASTCFYVATTRRCFFSTVRRVFFNRPLDCKHRLSTALQATCCRFSLFKSVLICFWSRFKWQTAFPMMHCGSERKTEGDCCDPDVSLLLSAWK